MINIEDIVNLISKQISQGGDFHPTPISLGDPFPQITKDYDEGDEALVHPESQAPIVLCPAYPLDRRVVAIDSTSFTLGDISEGIVGATRISVIIKPEGSNRQKLESYGPFLIAVTNQNKDVIYDGLIKKVFGATPDSNAPELYKMMDRIRNLLERHIQLEVVRNFTNSLILLDGSLIAGTVANPKFVLRNLLHTASRNNNCIVAISKSTTLTLSKSKNSILSLLDGFSGPCYVGGIKAMIEQDKDKYLGDIYVAKLTPYGEPFRIDIASDSPLPHHTALEMISGLAGDYGYPEELKLAHSTCVHSAVEIMELQALATKMHNLQVKENLRSKIFPFG